MLDSFILILLHNFIIIIVIIIIIIIIIIINSSLKKHVTLPVSGVVYSNKKETSDFHGTVSFDPVKI